MSGITPEGFDRKRLNEILSDLRLGFKAIFGDNLNVSPESSDGQVIGVVSAAFAQLWEIAEGSYNAFNPSIAKDAALTNLVQLNGIFRQVAIPSVTSLQITGTAGTLIPAGSRVSASDGSSTFTTDAQINIDGSGTVEIASTCTVDGPTIAIAGSLTVIDTPITGWASVTNPFDAVLGEDEESDADLRARRVRSVARPAQAIVDAIIAEILATPGVTQAFLYENDTDVTDVATGTLAKSFQCVVRGGTDEDVAAAIYREKPTGILAFGTTLVDVFDSQGFPHPIGLTRPTEVPIFVTVNITTFSDYPTNGADQIKQAIVDYANGDLIIGRGFNVKDDIINSELYTPVNTVQGFTVDTLFQGTSASPSTSTDIPIDFDEVGTFDVANIVVNETPSP